MGLFPGKDPITSIVTPTALGEGDLPLWLLSILYLISGVIVLWVLRQQTPLRVRSFRSGFLLLTGLSMWFRWILVTIPFRWTLGFSLLFLYIMLPIFLQFVTFSLLIVFLQKCLLILQRKEHLVNVRLYPIYATLLLTLLAGMCADAFYITNVGPALSLDDWDQQASGPIALMFSLLSVGLAIFGVRIFRVLNRLLLLERKMRRVRLFMIMSALFFAVFLWRGLWSLLYFLHSNPLQDRFNYWNTHPGFSLQYHFAFLIWYTLVEIVPSMTLVIVFGFMLPGGLPVSSIIGAPSDPVMSGSINAPDRSSSSSPFLSSSPTSSYGSISGAQQSSVNGVPSQSKSRRIPTDGTPISASPKGSLSSSQGKRLAERTYLISSLSDASPKGGGIYPSA